MNYDVESITPDNTSEIHPLTGMATIILCPVFVYSVFGLIQLENRTLENPISVLQPCTELLLGALKRTDGRETEITASHLSFLYSLFALAQLLGRKASSIHKLLKMLP